jgi:NADH dehydrogenase
MKRIVILGGGFGGIRCALDCAKKLKGKTSITLVDRNSYHSFTPALYEIASAYQPGDDPFALELRRAVAVPYKDIFAGKNIDLIQAEIASVDLTTSQVILDGGEHLHSDYLVCALGSQASNFGIPGVYEYAYQFKTIDDAVALHSKLEACFNDLVMDKVRGSIKFLIIGGGFTGIELAAELMTHARKISRRHNLPHGIFSAVLFEAAPAILPMVKESVRKKIMTRLTDLGVVIMANSSIENVLTDSVKLKTGQTMTGNAVIWTAGVQANRLLSSIHNLAVTDKGKVLVEDSLAIKNHKNIFALGDCIEFIDPKTQKPIPGLGYIAQAQGNIVAHNIRQAIFNKKLKKYNPEYGSWVAPVGGKFAVAHLQNVGTYSGALGWFIRVFIDLRYFLSILPFTQALKLFLRDTLLFSRND